MSIEIELKQIHSATKGEEDYHSTNDVYRYVARKVSLLRKETKDIVLEIKYYKQNIRSWIKNKIVYDPYEYINNVRKLNNLEAMKKEFKFYRHILWIRKYMPKSLLLDQMNSKYLITNE